MPPWGLACQNVCETQVVSQKTRQIRKTIEHSKWQKARIVERSQKGRDKIECSQKGRMPIFLNVLKKAEGEFF